MNRFYPNYFAKKYEKINAEDVNVLLIGVYPNELDPFFKANRKAFDDKTFGKLENPNYYFLSHGWLCPNLTRHRSWEDLQALKDYTYLDIDFNIPSLYNSCIDVGKFDLIFIDALVLDKLWYLKNFFEFIEKMSKEFCAVYINKTEHEKMSIPRFPGFKIEIGEFDDELELTNRFSDISPVDRKVDTKLTFGGSVI